MATMNGNRKQSVVIYSASILLSAVLMYLMGLFGGADAFWPVLLLMAAALFIMNVRIVTWLVRGK